jgi:N-dimethylarginine dimethylaminohydrolase
MGSRNEWDPLKKIVVGIADDAQVPLPDQSLRLVNYADKKFRFSVPHGPYPEEVIEGANKDLDMLSKFLTREGVEVVRPNKKFKPNYYNYCPRDTVLIVDDVALATPMSLTARSEEYKAMEEHFTKHKLIAAPQPDREKLYNVMCLGDPDILALNETDPCFDAANVLRANDDLYYLVSNSGNKKGAEYLQELFPNKKVHTIEGVYSYMHLDSTIAFLREGLMLLNPARIKSKDVLPKSLQSWDVIWAPEPYDIGYHPDYCHASTWISVNLLSVNPNLVIVERHQRDLARELEKHKIDVALLPMHHARTLGGCFHCVTLDLERKHD